MFRVLISIIFLVQDIRCEASTGELVLDTIAAPLVRFGDPDHLYLEDMTKLKEICDKYGASELEKESSKILPFFKGLDRKLAESVIPSLSREARQGCILLKNGEDAKAGRVAKTLNKKVESAQKLRFSFVTALTEAIKPETTATLSQVLCYIHKFCDKSVELYSDDEETKEFVYNSNKSLWGRIILVLEKENIKSDTDCQLPDANSNPSEFRSITSPLLKAIDVLEKK